MAFWTRGIGGGNTGVFDGDREVGSTGKGGPHQHASEVGKWQYSAWTRDVGLVSGQRDTHAQAIAAIAAASQANYDEATGAGGLASFFGQDW